MVRKVTMYADCVPYIDLYMVEMYSGLSTREINLYHGLMDDVWYGDVIEFGEWRNLEPDEIEQIKQYIEEKGYLSDEGRDTDNTQQPVGQ